MKKSDKQAIGKPLLNGSLSLLKGLVSGVSPIVGMVVGAGEGVVKSIQKEKENNLNSEVGGFGKIDLPRLLGFLKFIGLAAAFIAGWITLEDLKELIRLFNQTQ